MTDRTICLTVALENEIRTDDVEFIENAIRAIRGVLDVSHIIYDSEAHMNKWVYSTQLRKEFITKFNEVFKGF